MGNRLASDQLLSVFSAGGRKKPSLTIRSLGNFDGGSPSTASISPEVTRPLNVATKLADATC